MQLTPIGKSNMAEINRNWFGIFRPRVGHDRNFLCKISSSKRLPDGICIQNSGVPICLDVKGTWSEVTASFDTTNKKNTCSSNNQNVADC